MIHKFECWDCHKTFQADDQNRVKCPYCQSDNVDLASSHIPYKKIIVGTIVFVALGIGAYFLLQKETVVSPSGGDKGFNPPDTGIVDFPRGGGDPPISDYKEPIPPSITPVGEKTLNDDQTYSFKVVVDNAPTNSFKIVLIDKITGELVAESKDGRFAGVRPSKAEGGMYLIQIVDAKTDSLLCTPQTMDGFLPVKKVDRKLSVEELQKLLDSEDETLIGNGENPYLAPGYTINYKGLSNGDSRPANLADVIEKIYMNVWSSVKVESVEYDESSHISSITLKVIK